MKVKRNTKFGLVRDSVFERRFVSIGVIVSAIMVAVSIFVTVYFNPARVANRNFEKIARDYYENYYYDKLTQSSSSEAELEEIVGKYEESGFAPVLLRQLLLYNNKKNSEYEKYFTGSYKCDKNKSSAKFYPEKPYGRTDYRLEVNLQCE